MNDGLEWGSGYTIEEFGLREDTQLWYREDSLDREYVAFNKVCIDRQNRKLLVALLFSKTRLTAAHLYYFLPDEENQISPRYSLEREQARKQMHIAILNNEIGHRPPYEIKDWGWILTAYDGGTQMIRIQYD